MNSFSYYRCRLSDVIQSRRSLSLSHTLQLRLLYSHMRVITSDNRPPDVSPPVEEFRRFTIPQDCVLVRRKARDYVSEITLSMGFSLSTTELDRIVSCIYRDGGEEEIHGGGSIGVEASVSILRTDVIIGGDESHSDEKMILRPRPDSGSFHVSKNNTKLKMDGKEAEGDHCVICLEEVTDGRRNVKTSCNHSFHHQCLELWLNDRADCPICRALINLM